MFTGIINFISILYFIRYINLNYNLSLYLIIKNFNLNFLDSNLGDSFMLQGFCITLVYKNYSFMEFDVSLITILNIHNIENFNIINIEKSLKFFSTVSGALILGHINNKSLIIKNKKLLDKFYRLCILIPYFVKNFILYKSFICINGISFTVSSIRNFNRSYIFCINIICFTYNFTNVKFLNIFDLINIEIDLTFYYILNFLIYYL